MDELPGMQNSSSARARRERLSQILEGKVEINDSEEANSVLRRLASEKTPDFRRLKSSWPRSLGMATVLLIALMVFAENMEPGWLIGGIALVICAYLEAMIKCYRNLRDLRDWAKKLDAGLEELSAVREFIHNYLDQLDKRTSKYFHCVTNTKVTTYCILKQMLAALDERIEVISTLIGRGTITSLSGAQKELQEQISFRDGFLQNSGRQYFVPPAAMRPAVHLLVEELDDSLVELETEISVAKSKVPPARH